MVYGRCPLNDAVSGIPIKYCRFRYRDQNNSTLTPDHFFSLYATPSVGAVQHRPTRHTTSLIPLALHSDLVPRIPCAISNFQFGKSCSYGWLIAALARWKGNATHFVAPHHRSWYGKRLVTQLTDKKCDEFQICYALPKLHACSCVFL